LYTNHFENQEKKTMKTEAGKSESSKNALTHGLTAANIDRFPADLREDFAAQLARHHAEFQPVTLSEEQYLLRYAFAQFQIARAQALEAQALDKLLAEPESEVAHKNHTRLSRHLRTLERSADKALAELRTLIADRMMNMDADGHLGPKYEGAILMPPIFPHHLLTDKKSTKQPISRVAVRFEYSQYRSGPNDEPQPAER
jgi:hypothetical protein